MRTIQNTHRNGDIRSTATARWHARRAGDRAGGSTPLVIGSLVVLVFSLAAAWRWGTGTTDDVPAINPQLTPVTRGDFIAQVLDQGEVQSSENVEIRCEVRARNGEVTVLSVIPEGSSVAEGDLLVQLDSTSFEKELEQQKIAMANAETAKIQADTSLASSQAALNEYINGTFVENQKQIQNEIYDAKSEIKTAQQELKQAQAVLQHSKKLHAKAFITRQTLQADEFAVQRAEIAVQKADNSLELAQQKLHVLEEITFKKEKIQLESDIRAAQVKLSSETEAYAVEQEKLAEIKTMIKKCAVRVPPGVSGQVVYARQSSRRDDWVLEEGTTVRENQVLVRLPNPQRMEVKALINEQSITRIEPGMPASIKVDALNNNTLTGVVTRVSQYAESNGWLQTRVRKYAVIVRIIDPPLLLKPGMNASVAIQTQYVPDALLAPIQTIYSVQGRQFCLAKTSDGGWETLNVTCGGENAKHVFFQDGVSENRQLVMNPRAYVEHMQLPDAKSESRIQLPAGEQNLAQASAAAERAYDKSSVPPSGAALIKQKDSDGDGKLTQLEVGKPFSDFFERIDTDGDGFVNQAEADASLKQMRQRMKMNRQTTAVGGRG